jgi:DNA-binding Lrp family transcriptional regulator
MTVRAYVLIEADQTRVKEIKEVLPAIELDGSRVVAVDIVAGPYDLIATVESTDLAQLGR